MKNVIKLIGVMALTICSANVLATPITTPMTLSDSHIVGVIDTTGAGGGPLSGGAAVEMAAAQALLGLGIGGTTTIDFNIYSANTSVDFSATLTDYFKHPDSFFGDPTTVAQRTVSGYDFVMAKYDGPNAGYILFALDGGSHVIPDYPADFWTKGQQFALSHWTGFNATVPEPGMVALLAIGLLGMVAARRRIKV